MDNSIVEEKTSEELTQIHRGTSSQTSEELTQTKKIHSGTSSQIRYICSRCKKEFMKQHQFKEHMVRKYPCVIEYNTDYYCLKNVIKLRDTYKKIRCSAMLCYDTIDFELKYKALVDFYDNINQLLILIESDRSLTPSITEDMVLELKSYLKNCKTGQFD